MVVEGEAPLRAVVVGVGAGIFKTHARALQLPTVQLAGVCDINVETGCRRAEELEVPFYADYHEMLAAQHPDVAIVCTPHYNHARIAIDCMCAGCHVLVEKPMALEVAEADAMIAVAQQTGKLLAVNFQHRHRPEVRAARRLIEEGRLGTLQRMNLVTPWPRTARYYAQATWRATWHGEGGGVLMNQAPHDLDLVCHLMGRPDAVVAWTRTNLHQVEVEDTATALLSWDSGATGYLHVSTGEAGPLPALEIVGTGGIIQIGTDTLTFNEFEVDVHKFLAEASRVWDTPNYQPVTVELEEGKGDHVAVARNFHDAILHGAPIAADGLAARQSLELANAIILSSHKGTQVRLPIDRDEYNALLSKLKAGRHPE